MTYTIALKSLSGSTVVADVPATELSFNMNLNAPGGASITVPLRHSSVTPSNYAVGKREVYIYRGSELVWGGDLLVARAEAAQQVLRLSATGFYERLRRRLIQDDQVFDTVAASTIVEDLIDYTQGLTDGDMGLDASGFGSFGPSRTVHWCCWDGTTIADAIESLAARASGFDYEITPDKQVKGYYLHKALSSSQSFTLGTGPTSTTNILDLSVEADASEMANIVGGLPPDDNCLTCGDVVKSSDATSRSNYGRLEEAIDLSDIKRADSRQNFADRYLDDHRVPKVTVELTTTDLPFGGNYETGSQVSLTADLGWIAYSNTDFRILGWEVSVEQGYETASLTMDSVTY